MAFQLNRDSSERLAQQIKRALADRIHSGLIGPGEQLPRVRDLVRELGVSPVTVTEAYAALESAGLVVRLHGKGVFVRERPLSEPRTTQRDEHAWMQGVPDHVPRSFAWSLEGAGHGARVLTMQTAVVGADLVPVSDLMSDLQLSLRGNPNLLSHYAPIAGDGNLRQTAATYLQGLGVPATANEVIITQGAQQGIDLVARTFIGPGDAVAVESPAFPPAIDAFRARGATIVPVPVDGEGMQTDALSDIPNLRLVYTVPAFQNPTGAILSRRRRLALTALAQERHVLLLEDDPWRELSYDHEPPAPLRAMDTTGHVIYLKSFSKIFAVGVRLGALVASGLLFDRLLAAKGVADRGTALLPQLAVQPFLDSPRMGRYLRRLVAALRERRAAVLGALERHAPRGVRWTVPPGGLNVWITLPRHMDAQAVVAEAEKEGILLAPGVGFFVENPSLNCLRLSFGAAAPGDLERGVRVLCAILARS